MAYNVLKFEPKISDEYNIDNVLWKSTLHLPSNYKSDASECLSYAILNHDNRMLLKQWLDLIDNIPIKYEYEYDDKLFKKILIIESDLIGYTLDLHAVDIRSQYFYVEVQNELILALLWILEISKDQNYHPKYLKSKIMLAEEKIDQQMQVNKSTINILNQLDRLCTICTDYELDVKCEMIQRG